MSTDVALREQQPRQQSLLSNEQLRYIANTEFVPVGLRGNLPAILACVATGRELGLGDMAALRSIHVIDGRPAYSAELMSLLARRAGHSIQGETGPGYAKVVGKRGDNGDMIEVTWTLEMAERAGLLGRSNWRKYPEAMLWARAISQLFRELFADCGATGSYTPDEVEGVEAEDSSGEPEADPSVPRRRADGNSAGSATVLQAVEDNEPASPDDVEGAEAGPPAPPPSNDDALEEVFGPAPASDEREQRPATEAQKRKLNVLIGQKNPDRRRLYVTVAVLRVRDVDELILELGGRGDDGKLHFGPLRDALTRAEAHELIDRLEKLEDAPA